MRSSNSKDIESNTNNSELGKITYYQSNLSTKIDQLQKSASISTPIGQLLTKDARLGKRESVRSKIALRFIYAFFIFLLIAVLVGLYENFTFDQHKELLVTISSILSGPLGFIIGFYFKDAIE